MLAVKIRGDVGALTFVPITARCGTIVSCRDLRLIGYDHELRLRQVPFTAPTRHA